MRDPAMRASVVSEMARQGRAKPWDDPVQVSIIRALMRLDADGQWQLTGEYTIVHHPRRVPVTA
jgi:hypothetical protein